MGFVVFTTLDSHLYVSKSMFCIFVDLHIAGLIVGHTSRSVELSPLVCLPFINSQHQGRERID